MSNQGEVHVYSKLEHIRAWVEEFCTNEAMSAYHAIWYGATLMSTYVKTGVHTYGSQDYEGGGEIDPPFEMDEADDEDEEDCSSSLSRPRSLNG